MMKKTLPLALAATLLLAACRNDLPQARLETPLDTLAYCLGVGNALDRTALVQYLEGQGSDSTHIEDFLQGLAQGLTEGMEAEEPSVGSPKAQAYSAGFGIGLQLLDRVLATTGRLLQLDETQRLDPAQTAAGFTDRVHGSIAIRTNGKAATPEQLSDLATKLMERISDERAEALYGKEKRAGLEYIARQAEQPGVKHLADGIYYKELQPGSGPSPTMQSQVRVRYEGRLTDGKVFDATANHGTAQYDEFPVNGVIKGWQKALTRMSPGAKWEVLIPYDQAYGPAGNPPDIPPYSTLIFTMELISFQ